MQLQYNCVQDHSGLNVVSRSWFCKKNKLIESGMLAFYIELSLHLVFCMNKYINHCTHIIRQLHLTVTLLVKNIQLSKIHDTVLKLSRYFFIKTSWVTEVLSMTRFVARCCGGIYFRYIINKLITLPFVNPYSGRLKGRQFFRTVAD